MPAPSAAIARDPDVAAVAGSVVRILGTACGLGVEGSGWVAGDGLVVTNAHVVAGEEDTVVQVRGVGARLDATAVAFDATNDVAVLRVSGLSAPALTLVSDPPVGAEAAILGFPQNGPYSVRAGRLGQTRAVVSTDAYGNGPVTRQMTTFRGVVRPGNSGGPLVDTAGRVLTTVFAQSTGTTRHGRLRRAQRDRRAGPGRRGARGAVGLDRPVRWLRNLCQHRNRPGGSRVRSLRSRVTWERPSSSPRSRPSDVTSHGSCPGPSRRSPARGRRPSAGSRAPSTSSAGPSATSSSSPSPTSTTTSSRSGAWPTCRSCRPSSSWSCATSAPRSRCRWSRRCCAATTSTSSSTPATPAARAS